ncbi:MAG: HTH domain-containing protein [bacterium]|nr:HTH domain-containing protein [bacterium]
MDGGFLEKLIGNRARTRVIRVFIFNQTEAMTVATVAKRAGVSTQSVKREIKSLENLGIISKGKSAGIQPGKSSKHVRGKKSKRTAPHEDAWCTNPQFKHLRALSSFIHEVSPIRYDNILSALKNTGRLSAVIASGCFMGDVTRPVDLIVVADNVNEDRLLYAIKSLEPLSGREIRYSVFGSPEFSYRLTIQDRLIRDILDYPHMVLLDRTGVLK